MLHLFILTYWLHKAQSACNYQTFDSSQLNSSQFYGEKSYIREDFYAFGIWTMYAPVRINYHYDSKKIPFDPNITQSKDDGYHILNYKSDGLIQTLFKLSRVNSSNPYTPIYLSILQLTTTLIYQYNIPCQPLYFEGNWIFTYFSYQYSTNKYNFALYNTGDSSSFRSVQVTNQKFKPHSTQLTLEYGGAGLYQFGNFKQNLNIFPGRISYATMMDNPQFFATNQKASFLTYINNCFIPSPCTQQKEIKVLDGIYTYYNLTLTDYQFDLPGQRYYIEFWMKRDSVFEIQKVEYLLFYGSIMRYENQIRQMMITLKPFFELMDFTLEAEAFYYYPTDTGKPPSTLNTILGTCFQIALEQLKYWNFIRFDFYRNSVGQFLTTSVYTSSNNSYFQMEQMGVQGLYEYSNFQTHLTLMSYLYIEDIQQFTHFRGQIANLKITYCNSKTPDFNSNSNLNCHSQCKTCQGPTKWDCTSCYQNQNRELKENNMCVCLIGFKEETNSFICSQNVIIISKKSSQIQLKPIFCKKGYFEFYQNDIFLDCIPCPQGEQFECIDCLINSENWYLNPICKYFFTSDDGIYYSLQQKVTIDYFNIEYEQKSTKICSGCQTSSICNLNRFKQNGKCEQCANNCQICKNESCQKCENGYYLENNVCKQCNSECFSCEIMDNILQCTKCRTHYALNLGQCHKCGENCQDCSIRFTSSNVQYAKCTQCFSDTFPSLDGESCYYNPDQQYCIYPFQYATHDPQISTMVYNFEPQIPEFISNGCLYCTPYVFLNITDFNLQCVPETIDTLWETCIFPIILNNQITCLIGQQISIPQGNWPKPFIYFGQASCVHLLPNCFSCLATESNYNQKCLGCEVGYYNDYYTSFCKKCPFQCSTCIETDLTKVHKILSQPLFSYLFDFDLEDFLFFTQDPNQSHIQIFCTSCSDGYTIYEGQCILTCPSNCKECQIINNKNSCISCLQLNEYSYFTIQDGKCIECPTNCKLCLERTQEQQDQFNPYFNNQKYNLFINLCIQPFDDQLFYDQEIKQFINCIDCQNIVDFEINVLCNTGQTDTFIIKLEQLFNSNLNNYLQSIETDDYYFYLNQEYVKQINYKFIFQENSICQLNGNTYFTSTLQQNVFNLRYLNFIIEGNNSTFIINGSISLSNFTSIQINNLNIIDGTIITNNIKDYSVSIKNISVSSQNYLNLNAFQLNNVTNVVIEQILVNQMIYDYPQSLLAISNNRQLYQVTLKQWIIKASKFNFTSIFQYEGLELILDFSDIIIQQTKIISSQLIECFLQSELNINNLTISESYIENQPGLLKLKKSIILNNLYFLNSKIIDSIIIQTSAGLELNDCQFINLQLYGNSNLISANDFQSDSIIALKNIDYLNIIYEEKQAILSVISNENQQVSVFLQQIKLSQISLNQIFINQKIQEYLEQSIFFLECNWIVLSYVNIDRGLGFTEFTFSRAWRVTFEKAQITLNDQYFFRSLSLNQECQTSLIKPFYKALMIFYNVQTVSFNFLTIQKVILFDSVLIDFQQSINMSFPFIQITNSIFSSNIIHQISSETTVSLLRISSFQGLSIIFSNNTYNQNMLYIAQGLNVDTQGLLFNIVANQINIQLSTFEQNLILNGKSSIFLMESSQISIQDSVFKNNSIFQYITLKQFLIWGFEKEVFQEELEMLFNVSSHGGNGNMRANQIQIANSLINNSYSKQGAAFVCEILENGILNVSNSYFFNLRSELSGGCLFIQSNSKKLKIRVYKSKFSQIYSRQQGSIIYLDSSMTNVTINFKDSNFNNIHALQGPLLYIKQQNQVTPYFSMVNCLFSNQISFFQVFVNSISTISNQDFVILTKYFTLVYFTDGYIEIKNFTISEYPLISLFYFQSQVFLQDIIIVNNTFARPLFTFERNINSLKIQIDNFNIINCTITQSIYVKEEEIQNYQNKLIPTCTEYDLPKSLATANYSLGNQNEIRLVQFLSQQEIIGVILFKNFQEQDKIIMKNIQVQINCQNCQSGIFGFLNLLSPSIKIINIIISDSQCGIQGCLYFAQTSNRLLKEQVGQSRTTVFIQNLICMNNKAEQGGCIYLKNQQITIKDSRIFNNTATLGGAIYIDGKTTILEANNLFIVGNNALQGSGLFSTSSFLYTMNGIAFFDNSGQTLFLRPLYIQIEFFQGERIMPFITEKDQLKIVNKILTQKNSEAVIFLPSGIEIHKYRIFDMKSNSFKTSFQILRLYTLTQTLEESDLRGTYCTVQVVDKKGVKYPNLINQDTFYYNGSSYVLDNLILYLPQDEKQQYWLQFWCSSIFIPVIENGQIVNYHQNNYLLVKIRPYKCQLGEYHMNDSDYCHQCSVEVQEYSVTENSTYCSIKDDQIMSEITAAQVKLNSGYWRYQLTSNIFDLCFKKNTNCIGGWDYGNYLCSTGHIGALCEQCDYYNLMGNGYYAHLDHFECILCQNKNSIKSIIILLSSLSIFLILLLIYNSLSSEDQKRNLNDKALIQISQAIQGKYIQIMIWFFQIVSLVIELNQVFPLWIESIIDILGNPYQQMQIFNVCDLLDTTVNIVYLEFLQNLICLLIFVIIFQVLTFCKIYKRKEKYLSIRNINFLYLLYYYFAIGIVRSLLKLVSFRQIQSQYWIYQNVAYMFNTKTHLIAVFAGFLPILIFFGIFIPAQLLIYLANSAKNSSIHYFSIWFIAQKKPKLEVIKSMVMITNSIFVIALDGSAALRAALFLIGLIIYYAYTSFQPAYINRQQNKFEQSLIIQNIIILVFSTFWKVVDQENVSNIIKIFIHVIFSISCYTIIWNIFNMKFRAIITIKRKLFQYLSKNATISKDSCFYKYSEIAEQEHQRRMKKLKQFILKDLKSQKNEVIKEKADKHLTQLQI